MDRPDNWVTRDRQDRMLSVPKEDPFPDLTKRQVEWLKRNYPERCLDVARGEHLNDHILYAGEVKLAKRLCKQWDDRPLVADDSELDPTLVGERAS